MEAEIIHITKLQPSERNPAEMVKTITFKSKSGKVYLLHLVKEYRNFNRWQKFLKIGKVIYNLKLLDSERINGDSWPAERTNPEMPLEDEQLMHLVQEGGL